MNKTNELTIERKIELEEELSEYLLEKKDLSQLLLKYNLINSKYLIEAIYMPINEITRHIYRYDNSSPKLDELVFISELAKYYRVSKKDIIKRIQDIRRINKSNEQNKPSPSLVKIRKK